MADSCNVEDPKTNEETQDSEISGAYPADQNYYKLLQLITKGSGANVFKAFRKPHESSFLAIKLIHLQNPRLRFDTPYPGFDRESPHAPLPPHPNLLPRLSDFALHNNAARWVVMPYLSGGSLQSLVSSSFTNGLPEKFLAAALKKILSALAHLHSHALFHGNIKPSNFLLHCDGSVMLTDSGVSASIYNMLPPAVVATTYPDKMEKPYWSAPEVGEHVYLYVGYGDKAEIWSFGVAALELAIGRPPISDLPYHRRHLMLMISERFRFQDPIELTKHGKKGPPILSERFRDMVERCLDQEPWRRPSVEELLRHPFFEGADDVLVEDLLVGLPPVEQRQATWAGHETAGRHDYLDKAVAGRITRWELNKERFELDPADLQKEAAAPDVAERRRLVEELLNTGADSVQGMRMMHNNAFQPQFWR